MGAMKDKAVGILVNELLNDGKKIIDKAFSTADFRKDKTQNLHDSYGCAVYYNGSLLSGKTYVLSPRATERVKGLSGAEEIQSFFKTYKAVPKGFELVTAVAIFYGEILSNASGGQKRKYKVIANAVGDLTMLSNKYKGSSVHIITQGERQ